jgi:ribosomal protein S18 acetylase RimI-like enzyme
VTRLRIVEGDEFSPYIEATVEVYVAAMRKSRDVVPARRAITSRHLLHPGLRAAIAQPDDEDRLVGFAYGYRGEPGQWWHDAVADELTRQQRKDWLSNAFEVAELHVLPDWQQRGIGKQLLHLVCRDVSAATVVLSAIDEETPARTLYRSLGFQDLLLGFTFAGSSERYAVMGRPLPLDEPAPSPRL